MEINHRTWLAGPLLLATLMAGGIGGSETAYIEVETLRNYPLETFRSMVPTGALMVFYLSDISDATGIADPDAGRPAGVKMYHPGPQGWIILDEEAGQVVMPLTGLSVKASTLEGFIPDGSGTAFPVLPQD